MMRKQIVQTTDVGIILNFQWLDSFEIPTLGSLYQKIFSAADVIEPGKCFQIVIEVLPTNFKRQKRQAAAHRQ
jgi:hypothetical protein